MEPPSYMPILRGKTNELITLEVAAPLFQSVPIFPIVEPVSFDTGLLERVVEFYINFKIPLGIIVNPAVGEFVESSQRLLDRLEGLLTRATTVFPVARTSVGGIDWARLKEIEKFVLLDDGPPCDAIRSELIDNPSRILHRIIDTEVARGREEHSHGKRILLRDGFIRRRNIDYPLDEKFHSGPHHLDLQNAAGWGDYLTVGRGFQNGGGRPHAVAIHITYWVPGEGLRVHHFLSDSNDGPENPAGKFAEAVEKLVTDLDQGIHPITATEAIEEFRKHHATGHFPGLGILKRLSMWHHLELIAHRLLAQTVSRTTATNSR